MAVFELLKLKNKSRISETRFSTKTYKNVKNGPKNLRRPHLLEKFRNFSKYFCVFVSLYALNSESVFGRTNIQKQKNISEGLLNFPVGRVVAGLLNNYVQLRNQYSSC